MTQFAAAVQAVREFAQQPIVANDAFPDNDAQLLQDACFKNLLTLCHQATPSERNEVLVGLASVIASASDSFQASRVAMVCGILVEWGADPTIALSAILDRLELALGREEPIASLRRLIMPAMSMLCLDVNSRRAARNNAKLVKHVESFAPLHREVKFLHRLFNLVDGEELIVLHPQENQGFRVRLEAIATNFHLFSLLQDALVGEPSTGLLVGPRPNRKVIATAKGDMPHDRLITDAAVWHYYNWTAMQHNGTLGALPTTTWVVGEQTPRAVPAFEGERIVLLGPPTPATRAWDSSFFTNLHEALRSKVEIVEILSADEVALRLRRIQKSVPV